MGSLRDANYYDRIYAQSEKYGRHYSKSHYFPLWKKVLEQLNDCEVPVLEIGCGTGQLAHYLADNFVRNYTGFDFSNEAIQKADDACGSVMKFLVGNALEKYTYEVLFGFKTVIACEVFEHTDDMKILSHLPEGTTIILTVPDFDDPAHIRYFKTIEEVRLRYSPRIAISHLEKFQRWYLLVGKVLTV